MSHGGARVGAGRPAGKNKVGFHLRLDPKVVKDLRATIAKKSRSAWIEQLIIEGLRKYQKSL